MSAGKIGAVTPVILCTDSAGRPNESQSSLGWSRAPPSDRIAAVHESGYGTSRTSGDVRLESAKWNKADIDWVATGAVSAASTPGLHPAATSTRMAQPMTPSMIACRSCCGSRSSPSTNRSKCVSTLSSTVIVARRKSSAKLGTRLHRGNKQAACRAHQSHSRPRTCSPVADRPLPKFLLLMQWHRARKSGGHAAGRFAPFQRTPQSRCVVQSSVPASLATGSTSVPATVFLAPSWRCCSRLEA